MSGKVKAKIELPDLSSAIHDATATTLTDLAGDALELIRGDIWKGFKYGKYYPNEQQGTSGNSWRINHLQPGEAGFSYGFTLYNDATIQARTGTYEPIYWGRKSGVEKSYKNTRQGQYYAAFVQKATDSEPLAAIVEDRIESELVPEFETELLINILNATANNVERVELRADDESIGTFNFNL
jgi:hypothetical protein|tara:strand:- start:272 stop:820 length:549 start_codon:yes stop_codon:yes gene_type:complete